MKIKLRKFGLYWCVLVPGDIPEFARFEHWTDAAAKVQYELRMALGSDRKPVGAF